MVRTVGHENASHVFRLKNAIAYRIKNKRFIGLTRNKVCYLTFEKRSINYVVKEFGDALHKLHQLRNEIKGNFAVEPICILI